MAHGSETGWRGMSRTLASSAVASPRCVVRSGRTKNEAAVPHSVILPGGRWSAKVVTIMRARLRSDARSCAAGLASERDWMCSSADLCDTDGVARSRCRVPRSAGTWASAVPRSRALSPRGRGVHDHCGKQREQRAGN